MAFAFCLYRTRCRHRITEECAHSFLRRCLSRMDAGSGQGGRAAEEGQQCWEAFSMWLLLNNSIPVSLSVERVRLRMDTWEERSAWPFDLLPQQPRSSWTAEQTPRLSAAASVSPAGSANYPGSFIPPHPFWQNRAVKKHA